MSKNIVVFKIDKKIDFQNHLIGIDAYKKHKMTGEFLVYYKELAEVAENKRHDVFLRKTKWFYDAKKKKIHDLILKQTQETWGLVEKEYIKRLEKIHNRKFLRKKIYGVLSTAYRFGYNYGSPAWFACNCNSPVRCADTAMHEIMHLMFHDYFWVEWKKKFSLSDGQMQAIKEALTVILNVEFNDLRFSWDGGHFGHEKLREKIAKDWKKSKNFEKVLDKACEYVKKNKLFL